jgi:hypothetical protein
MFLFESPNVFPCYLLADEGIEGGLFELENGRHQLLRGEPPLAVS